MGEAVQEAVRRDIVALSPVTDDRGDRGEQDEAIQRQVLGQAVKIPAPWTFGAITRERASAFS